MSKIVQAVNAMISNSDKITHVRVSRTSNEYYFVYNGKYVWGIWKFTEDEEFGISNYPVPVEYFIDDYVDRLSNIENPEHFERINSVNYNTKELKTREAKESFSELYTIVKEKILGVDEILDDIIKDADPPF